MFPSEDQELYKNDRVYGAATMAKLDDMDSVKAKSDEIGEPKPDFTRWNGSRAKE